MEDKKTKNKTTKSFPGDFDTLVSLANNKPCTCEKKEILKPEFITL